MTKKKSLAARKTISRVETQHNENQNVISRHTTETAYNFSPNNIPTITSKMHLDYNCASTPKNVRRPPVRNVSDYSPSRDSVEVGWDSPKCCLRTGKPQPGGTAIEYASMMSSSIPSDARLPSPPSSSSSDDSSPIMKLRYTSPLHATPTKHQSSKCSISPILRMKKEAALNSKSLVLSVISALNAVAAEEAKKLELHREPKLNLEKSFYSEERNCTKVAQSLSIHSTPKMKRVARPLTDIDNLCATPTHNCHHNHFDVYSTNNKLCNHTADDNNNNYNKNKRVRISDASNNELMNEQTDDRMNDEKVNDSAWDDEDSLFGDSVIEATQRIVDDFTLNNNLNVNIPVLSTTNSLTLNNNTNYCTTTASTEASIKMLRKKANLVGASSSSLSTSSAHTTSSNCFIKPVMSSSTNTTTHMQKITNPNFDRKVAMNKTSNFESISDVSISDDLLISSYLPTDNLMDDTIVPTVNNNDLDTLSFNSALNKLNDSSFSDKQKEGITNVNGTVVTSSTSSSSAVHQAQRLIVPKQLKMQQKSKFNQLVYQQPHKQQPNDMSPELFNTSTCEETDMLEFLDLVESQVDPIKSKQKLESAFNSVVNYLEAAGNNRCTNTQISASCSSISTTSYINTKITTSNFQCNPTPTKNIFSSNSISIKSSSFYPVKSSNSIKNNTPSTAFSTLGKSSLLSSHPQKSSTPTFTSSANNSSKFATSTVHIAPPTSNVSHVKNIPAVPHITSSTSSSLSLSPSSVTITTKNAFLTKNNSAFFNNTCTNNNTRSNYKVAHSSSAMVPSSSSRVILQPVSKPNGFNNNNRYNSMNNINNNNNNNKKDNIFSRKSFSSDNIKPTLQFHGNNTNGNTNVNKVCTGQQKQQQETYNSSIKVCYTTEEIERKRREAVMKLTARSQVKHC